ncbi:MAG: MFS transporter [Methylococcaceae bacterium]|nr:MFS transporter [Methylococcaceae bacterium]
MSRTERRGVFALSGIFGLRMLGLFMILPILAILAEDLQGATPFLIGLAISAYGLTQALFQIPYGMLSDRFGRKLMISIGLAIFAGGSVVAAFADSIQGVIVGRALQGSGAIAGPVMAMAADLTREVHRTKAMALIGITIGISFAISMVVGPIIAGAIGLHGLFWVIAGLALSGIGMIIFCVPNPVSTRVHRDTEALPEDFGQVLRNAELLRLDFGILLLHIILTGSFVVFPVLLRDAGLAVSQLWAVYLPVLLLSISGAIPFIVYGEKKHKIKPVFIGAILVIALAHTGLLFFHQDVYSIAVFLFVFFCGFNLLEATLPSLISKIAPLENKGTAMGIYSTAQFLGAFLGGAGGGWLNGKFGVESVFIACAGFAIAWLVIAITMQPPRYLSSLLLNVGELDESLAARMSEQIAEIPGVKEAIVLAHDGVAYLKVDKNALDYSRLRQLVREDR